MRVRVDIWVVKREGRRHFEGGGRADRARKIERELGRDGDRSDRTSMRKAFCFLAYLKEEGRGGKRNSAAGRSSRFSTGGYVEC